MQRKVRMEAHATCFPAVLMLRVWGPPPKPECAGVCQCAE